MNTYRIYMKSHSEAPDYEDWCEAESKLEAAEIFAKKIGQTSSWESYWDAEDLVEHIKNVPRDAR